MYHTVQWAEEHVRKDVCRLDSKLASTANTQIESGQTKLTETFMNFKEVGKGFGGGGGVYNPDKT